MYLVCGLKTLCTFIKSVKHMGTHWAIEEVWNRKQKMSKGKEKYKEKKKKRNIMGSFKIQIKDP